MIQPGRDGLCRQREIAGGSGDDRSRAGGRAVPRGRPRRSSRSGGCGHRRGRRARVDRQRLGVTGRGARSTAGARDRPQRAGWRPADWGSGAPAGWSPVPFRRAQLSVPESWLVQSPGQFWCVPRSRGMIFAGGRPAVPEGAGCRLTASLAWIRPAGHIPPGIRHRRPAAVIHGLPVYRLPGGPGSVPYLVPELGGAGGAPDRWPAGCWPH